MDKVSSLVEWTRKIVGSFSKNSFCALYSKILCIPKPRARKWWIVSREKINVILNPRNIFAHGMVSLYIIYNSLVRNDVPHPFCVTHHRHAKCKRYSDDFQLGRARCVFRECGVKSPGAVPLLSASVVPSLSSKVPVISRWLCLL